MTVVLALVAVVLMLVNAGSVILTGTFSDRGAMWSQVFGFAILGPGVLAALFLVARSNRNWRRYLMAFCVVSALAGATQFMEAVESTRPKAAHVVRATGSAATLSVPADWRSAERKTNQAIYVVNRTSTEAVAVSSIPKAEAAQDFDAFVTQLLANQRGLPSFRGATGPVDCPTKAVRCQAHEIRHASGQTVVVSMLHVVESTGAYHVLIASTNEPLYARSKAQLAEIAASFDPKD